MSIEISPSLSQPKPTIKLWTPNTIGALTFFLGFPVGIVLATINWIKMGMTRKIIPHVFIGIAGIVALIFLPDNFGRIVGLALSWGYIAFFRKQMKSDIDTLDRYDVQNARWYSGFFISIGIYGIVFIVGMAFIFVQSVYESIMPGNALYHSNRGDNHLNSGNYDLAIEEYTKAIELDLNYSDAYLNRGVAYGSMGETDSAFLDFNKVIELSPDDPFGYYNRGFAYESMGEYEQAIIDYSKAIELDPNNAEEVLIRALEQRAVLYESLGRTSDAIHDFEELLKIMTDVDRRKLVEERLKELK